ncbi:MAG: FAD:protein FMN transferase [Planctomycetes bacterium]|nr:FAD:protein FMN transferase [Planctomycetota bacterium]
MKQAPTIVCLSCLALAASQLVAQQADAPIVRRRETGVMGTDLVIEVEGADAGVLDGVIDAAIAELQRVEDLMTSWRASPLTELNAAAGKGPHETPRELAAIVGRAREVSVLTGGAFDCTFASVGSLWDFKRRPPVVPERAAVLAALANVGSTRITIDPEHDRVTLPAGVQIGLGGIAKGYGVDRAMAVLRANGIRRGLVNAGGDMKVLSPDRPYEVAIKHPRDRDRAIAVVRAANTCVVTSGDYERFFEYEGKRYHHILDPRTGYPSTGCMSATVTGPSAELCDALATACCVLGPTAGLELIAKVRRYEAILVGMDGEVHASKALRPALCEH